MERDLWAFGAGRPIRPGMAPAEHGVLLAVAHLLWAFDVAELRDEAIDLNDPDFGSAIIPVC
ncbi:hypothetical protein BD413DRAFT_616153 [Trametes elegans]|nr:hypothetical protein BD413DRAFT_616153 [Trametes elegans]